MPLTHHSSGHSSCLLIVSLLTIFGFVAATAARAEKGYRGACGDQGDGTYLNPILPGDFSDPDVIRVGDRCYLITSTFQYSPGMAVMESKDLVNWRYLGHCIADLA